MSVSLPLESGQARDRRNFQKQHCLVKLDQERQGSLAGVSRAAVVGADLD